MNTSVNSLHYVAVCITSCVSYKCVVGAMSDGRVAMQLARDSDIHVITGLLKLYFRELPESLFTDALYPNLVTGMGTVDSLFTFLCLN